MERVVICFGAAIVLLAVLRLFSAPIRLGTKLLINTVLGFGGLWLFNAVGGLMGVTLGLNLLNAAVVGIFGPAGLVMLLFLRWMSL